ncbi:MAG: hypothetical protein D6812_00855, partial [Deltaproteobacteria bacterium]
MTAGVALVAGGFLVLVASGYDAFNLDVWRYAALVAVEDFPGLMASAASGPDAQLFRGVASVVVGVV